MLVPGNESTGPVLRVFRFHPCSASYNPLTAAAEPFTTITLAASTGCSEANPADECIASTPLVYRHSDGRAIVVVQTSKRLRAYDIDLINPASICAPTPYTADPLWVFPPVSGVGAATFGSIACSPTIGTHRHGSPSPTSVFAIGRLNGDAAVQLVALDPDTGALSWSPMFLRNGDGGLTTPAIGPAIDSLAPEQTLNFVYVTCKHDGGGPGPTDDFFAVLADGSLKFGRRITSGGGQQGTYASPGVQDVTHNVIVPADKMKIVSYDNEIPWFTGELALRWEVPSTRFNSLDFVSASAGLFRDGNFSVWAESTGWRLLYSDPPPPLPNEVLGAAGKNGDKWGGPALDSFERAFSASPASLVMADRNEVTVDPGTFIQSSDPPTPRIVPAWTDTHGRRRSYNPPTDLVGDTVNLRQPHFSHPAIDEDGTIIVCNDGFVMALRPVRGDMNGDGCRNNHDTDAFIQIMFDLPGWEATVGDEFGVNTIGVCDCNNDGLCNFFDIDCFADLIINQPVCLYGDLDDGIGGPPTGTESFATGLSESGMSDTSDAETECGMTELELAEFQARMDFLRAYFGLTPGGGQ